jgi:hypothetical protein
MATPTIIDLRNIYNPSELREDGLTYMSIGRAQVLARLLLMRDGDSDYANIGR